jgi:hypothetical protein
MPRPRPALAAVLAALSLVACGGGSDADSGAAPSPSAAAGSSTPGAAGTDAAFLAQLEVICADLAATAPDQAPELTTPEQVQAYTAEFAANFATAQAAFAQLPFPADDTGRRVERVEFGVRAVSGPQSAPRPDVPLTSREECT